MDGSRPVGLVAVLVLVLVNGFFVAAEFALVAVRASRLEELIRGGNARARAAKHVIDRLDTYIAACQLGITMASLALGWIGEPALAHFVEPPIERLLGRFAPAAAHGIAIAVSFAVITALHIVAGELAPKGLALQRPDETALWVARPLQLFYAVFRWPIIALNAVGNATLRLFGLNPASGHDMVHSVEELQLLLRASQKAGLVEESEARIASRAFHLADLTASSLMTPRTELEAIPEDIDRDELLARVAASRHSRVLVCRENLDDVVGIIRVRDLVPYLARPGQPIDVRSLIRPVPTVPEKRPADHLLEDMQRTGEQLAVVVDEYGGTAGVVTLADVMRALVGRIADDASGAAAGRAVTEPDGSMLLDGLMRIHEFEELIGRRLEEADRAQVETLSGLVMARLGRLPQVGDEITLGSRRLRVERLEGRRVGTLRLMPS